MYNAGPYNLADYKFKFSLLTQSNLKERFGRFKASTISYSLNSEGTMLIPAYTAVPMVECTDTYTKKMKEYWGERGIPVPDEVSFSCIDDTDVFIES